MVTRRLYKKRSYKKRRTIRKLKTTLRRKIQRGGGNPEEDLIRLVLKLVLGNIEPFVRICVLLATMTQMGGRSSKSSRLYQTGGALSQKVKDELILKLSQLKQSFTEKLRPDVVTCIETIEKKVNTEKTSAENMPMPSTSTVEDELTSQEQSTFIKENLTKFKEVIREKVKQKIESMVTKLQTILNGEEYNCFIKIKDAVLGDFINKLTNNSIFPNVNKLTNNSIFPNVKNGLSAMSNKFTEFTNRIDLGRS